MHLGSLLTGYLIPRVTPGSMELVFVTAGDAIIGFLTRVRYVLYSKSSWQSFESTNYLT